MVRFTRELLKVRMVKCELGGNLELEIVEHQKRTNLALVPFATIFNSRTNPHNRVQFRLTS